MVENPGNDLPKKGNPENSEEVMRKLLAEFTAQYGFEAIPEDVEEFAKYAFARYDRLSMMVEHDLHALRKKFSELEKNSDQELTEYLGVIDESEAKIALHEELVNNLKEGITKGIIDISKLDERNRLLQAEKDHLELLKSYSKDLYKIYFEDLDRLIEYGRWLSIVFKKIEKLK